MAMRVRLFPLVKHLPSVKRLVAERDQLRERCARLEARTGVACDCLPAPPAHLRARVAGFTDLDKFLGIGRTVLGDLKILVEQAGRDFDTFHSILDFGCGCGRVARYLRPDGRSITGTDIDVGAIEWCRENLRCVGTFDVNGHAPPLNYPDQRFDFIYAISVFTHLPEDLEVSWLKELRRILKPGGLLIATTIGEADLRTLVPDNEEALRQFQQSGFYFTTKFKTENLPDLYGLSFHERSYIEAEWSKYFNILVFYPKAINNHQDGIVLSKMA
jgi:SAM-dependent methyltransferase